jgi:hypothetical protein
MKKQELHLTAVLVVAALASLLGRIRLAPGCSRRIDAGDVENRLVI